MARFPIYTDADVRNDQPAIEIAKEWLKQGRPFIGVITWPQEHYLRMSNGDFLRKFEELAGKDLPLNPFYPIVYFHPY